MKQVYRIDDLGYYVEPVLLTAELDDNLKSHYTIPIDCVEIPPLNGLYKPKWTGNEWIEGKTDDEFLEDAFLESLNPSEKELAKAERELETIELLLEMGLI